MRKVGYPEPQKPVKPKRNYGKLDFPVGMAMMFSTLVLQVYSPWVLPFNTIVGMNLAMGNWRHLYNYLRKKHVS